MEKTIVGERMKEPQGAALFRCSVGQQLRFMDSLDLLDGLRLDNQLWGLPLEDGPRRAELG